MALKTPLTACPLPEQSILNAMQILNKGTLCRYGEAGVSGLGYAPQLERRFAQFVKRDYAVAVNSGVGALFLALRAAGVNYGDRVLCSAFTLSCVPGAIEKLKAITTLVDTDPLTLTVDLDHLRKTIMRTQAKYFVLSHMRGHIADLSAIEQICQASGVTMIEDCAHAIGSTFHGRQAGTFGKFGTFSFQAFKQINAGEMGMVVTSDPSMCAKIIVSSGSYMNYDQHGTVPDPKFFESAEYEPNYSMRASELSAAVALPQVDLLEDRNTRWREIHDLIQENIQDIPKVRMIQKLPGVVRTPSSIQFFLDESPTTIQDVCNASSKRGVPIKWFGTEKSHGFTSRYVHWKFVNQEESLPGTDEATSRLLDVRLPYSLTNDECLAISDIIRESIALCCKYN